MHVFDHRGRHLQTRDAASGGTLFTLAYNASGQLDHVIDASGDVTRRAAL